MCFFLLLLLLRGSWFALRVFNFALSVIMMWKRVDYEVRSFDAERHSSSESRTEYGSDWLLPPIPSHTPVIASPALCLRYSCCIGTHRPASSCAFTVLASVSGVITRLLRCALKCIRDVLNVFRTCTLNFLLLHFSRSHTNEVKSLAQR